MLTSILYAFDAWTGVWSPANQRCVHQNQEKNTYGYDSLVSYSGSYRLVVKLFGFTCIWMIRKFFCAGDDIKGLDP